jgi:hypothetical protein
MPKIRASYGFLPSQTHENVIFSLKSPFWVFFFPKYTARTNLKIAFIQNYFFMIQIDYITIHTPKIGASYGFLPSQTTKCQALIVSAILGPFLAVLAAFGRFKLQNALTEPILTFESLYFGDAIFLYPL